jgi:hypothetical protein
MARPTTPPLQPIRNGSKFQPMPPPNLPFVSFAVSYLDSGVMPGPFTTNLHIMGKVTSYIVRQDCAIPDVPRGDY